MSGGFAVFQLLLRGMWSILEEWGCFRHGRVSSFVYFCSICLCFPVSIRISAPFCLCVACLLISVVGNICYKVAEGTQHWPFCHSMVQWGLVLPRFPMLEESWFFWQRDDAPMLGFRRVDLQGSLSALFWIHVVWSHLCVSCLMVCCIYMFVLLVNP